MSWRIIVRYSLNYDAGSTVGNQIDPVLQNAGLTKTGTRTWESQAINPASFSASLNAVMQTLQNLPGAGGNTAPHVGLDHLWLYVHNTDT